MKTTYTPIILFTLVLFGACKKDNKQTTVAVTPTVYVLGTINSTDDINIYWKNGVANNLPSSVASLASAGAFFVSGNDVYIAGGSSAFLGIGPTSTSSAEYSKNGAITTLPDSSGQGSYANCIFVSGNEVYAAGVTSYQSNSTVPYTTPTANYPKQGVVATYWNNGVAATLSSAPFIEGVNGHYNSVYADYVSSIFVSGNDVYVAGGSNQYETGVSSTYQFARYWKNGVATDLAEDGLLNFTSGENAYPVTTGISASGSDVYVCGYELALNGGQVAEANKQALYWKNGVANFLTTNAQYNSMANAIFTVGSDVYIAGYETINGNYICATVWKNGVATNLATTTSSAQSIFVSGNDVYVAGYEYINGGYYAVYWKNGTAVKLSTNASANYIYVQ